ncbi:hypothetical protein [Saccharothrix luteola]|uniref:hypothetical protein n=1 Tax=Saccharothrix luteola TaxID=2893018 RepID=UPI001E40226A|nr:hypothetical protein [Saccharothrix luteola]MCC8242750.1 hypothetical protein [Saccharothrix luteola]
MAEVAVYARAEVIMSFAVNRGAERRRAAYPRDTPCGGTSPPVSRGLVGDEPGAGERSVRAGNGDHVLMTNPAEVNSAISSGYVYEGVAADVG